MVLCGGNGFIFSATQLTLELSSNAFASGPDSLFVLVCSETDNTKQEVIQSAEMFLITITTAITVCGGS